MGGIVILRERNLVSTCVTIPEYLRAHAKERGISLSGTLREALRRDYEEQARIAPHLERGGERGAPRLGGAPGAPAPPHEVNR